MNATDFLPQMLTAAGTVESLDSRLRSLEAHCALLAIAGQESGWQSIQQHGGPARGPWQFEINGVRALTSHLTVGRYMPLLARACGVGIDPASIHEALIGNLPLAYGCARLLLLTAPWPLPAIGDEDETLQQYRWCWRPGAWNDDARAVLARQRWAQVYQQAVACFPQPEPAASGEQEN